MVIDEIILKYYWVPNSELQPFSVTLYFNLLGEIYMHKMYFGTSD